MVQYCTEHCTKYLLQIWHNCTISCSPAVWGHLFLVSELPSLSALPNTFQIHLTKLSKLALSLHLLLKPYFARNFHQACKITEVVLILCYIFSCQKRNLNVFWQSYTYVVTFPTPAPTFKLCRLASLKGNTITQGRVVIFNEIILDPHTPNNNPKVENFSL